MVDDVQQQLKRRPNRLSLADGGIAMQDLLKHFGIGHEALSRRDQALQEKLRLAVVRVRRTDEGTSGYWNR